MNNLFLVIFNQYKSITREMSQNIQVEIKHKKKAT